MNKQTILKLLAALFAFWVAPNAFAANPCKLDPKADNVLGKLVFARGLDCFGSASDPHPLAVKVFAIQHCDPSTPVDDAHTRKELLELRRQLADASREIEAASNTLASGAPLEWADVFNPLGVELQKSTNELQDIEAVSDATDWEWRDHSTRQVNGQFLISYKSIVEEKCPVGVRPDCANALAIAIEVNRLVNLTHRLHQCAGQGPLTRVRKRLAELDAAWDKYFFGTRSQYIWELAINSKRFNGHDNVFAEPPVDQLIVMHPGVTFEYVGGGAQNDDAYDAILMAEVIGYNRFTWANGSKLPPLGISIVGTYSPDNTGEHLGYGVMFHIKNVYSFGVARRDTGAGDETVYLLSADLMKLILKPSDLSMKDFRGDGSPIAGQN